MRVDLIRHVKHCKCGLQVLSGKEDMVVAALKLATADTTLGMGGLDICPDLKIWINQLVEIGLMPGGAQKNLVQMLVESEVVS